MKKHLSIPMILLVAIVGLAFNACGQMGDNHTALKAPSLPDGIEKVVKSSDEWRKDLTAEEYHVLREKGTERAFSGDLWNHKGEGQYTCSGCGFALFDSKTKFKSGTGWPSFFQPLDEHRIKEIADNSYGWNRVEVVCNRCDGHLGHVFDDGPNPTGLRYCINSASLDFEGTEGKKK